MTSTTKTASTTPSLPSGTPPLVTRSVQILAVAIPIVLSIWRPNHSFSQPAVQAAILVAGVLVAGIVHVVELVSRNGLTKAGLTKTVSEEEAWITAHYTELQTLATAGREIVGSIDPQLVAQTASAVSKLQAQLDAIHAVDPTVSNVANLLSGHSVVTTTGTVDLPTATTAPAAADSPGAAQ